MADVRTNSANAFETVLTQEFGPTSLTASLEAVQGLGVPTYLTFDPDNTLVHREYILFDGAISGLDISTTTLANRYLTGSVASSGITHPVGTVVRMTPTKQQFDDIHDRVDGRMAAASHTKSVHDSLGIDHGSMTGLADDDHPQYHTDARGDARYVRNTGGTLTGAVLLPDGTVAAPSLGFSLDTNTGLRRVTTDALGIVAGGVDVAVARVSDFHPGTTNVRDLGLTGTRWRDLYLSRDAFIAGRTNLVAYRETPISLGTVSSGTATINVATGTIFTLTAGGAISIATSNVVNGDSFLLRLYMASLYAITWPTGTRWADGKAPTLAAGSNIVSFWYESGVLWGSLVGTKFA